MSEERVDDATRAKQADLDRDAAISDLSQSILEHREQEAARERAEEAAKQREEPTKPPADGVS